MSKKAEVPKIINLVVESMTEEELKSLEWFILGRNHTFKEQLIWYLEPLIPKYKLKKSKKIIDERIKIFRDYSSRDPGWDFLKDLEKALFKYPFKQRMIMRKQKRKMAKMIKHKRYS